MEERVVEYGRKMLLDNHGRNINYLRLAVTDRCNLRCFYCMPEHGLQWLERKELMSFEEMLRVCTVLVNMGINKIRITGGEPFVRKDIMQFLTSLSKLKGLNEIAVTTNGVQTAPLIPDLIKLGIKSINLSLDSLDRQRFFSITRRDELPAVLDTYNQLLNHKITLRLNAVVMDGKNIEDILPLVDLAKNDNVSVRFIEEMPFNGTDHEYLKLEWDHVRILNHIKEKYPDIKKIPDPPHSTSYNYKIPGHAGTVGIIAAYTRSFCGTCNRIRITPQGVLKTCLYDHGVLNIRDLIRGNNTDIELQNIIINTLQKRAINGWETEKARNSNDPVLESMASIGG